MDLVDLKRDVQIRRFEDVLSGAPAAVGDVVAVIGATDARQRMIDAVERHRRPALAGVVTDIETLSSVKRLFTVYGVESTFARRFKMFVGAVVRVVMAVCGYATTGSKGSMRRISKWFTRAEIYRRH